MNERTQITVWPDDSEGRPNCPWVVSLDVFDFVRNQLLFTDTLARFKNTYTGSARTKAIKAAKKLAQERQLPLVDQGYSGKSTPLNKLG